jgi:DNA-binding protein H-NS
MSRTLKAIQEEINALKIKLDELEQEAQAVRDAEVSNVIAGIKQSMADFGITGNDLFGVDGKPGRKGGKGSGAKTPNKPRAGVGKKYRDPQSGDEWSGMGRPPAWIRDAADRDRFLISRAA